MEITKVECGALFGRWTVESFDRVIRSSRYWFCVCSCGVRKSVKEDYLRSKRSQSCGCLAAELVSGRYKQHTLTLEYGVWSSMKARCFNPNAKSYSRYGGRGIKVCERWMRGENGKTGFECFLEDVGPRPKEGKRSIDRRDNDGDYTPDNCYWATDAQQRSNTRRNHWVEYKGKKMILADAIRLSGLPAKQVDTRLRRGWSLEDALEKPLSDYDEERCVFVEVDGERLNLKDAAKKKGIKYTTVYMRVKNGWSVEDALNLNVKKVNRVYG